MKLSNKVVFAVSILAMLCYAISCTKKPLPDSDDDNNGGGGMVEMTPYKLPVPTRFPQPVIPENNQLYVERIALGKKLFFDNRLSNDGSTCESCHKPEFGFAIDGLSTFPKDKKQTILPLVNLAWRDDFFWDGRLHGTLEDVMNTELTERFNTDLAKINAIAEYRTMFRDYYGATEITKDHVAKALAQYMRVLVSGDTKFDRYLKGAIQLTAMEDSGRALFFGERGDCFHCHTILLTTDDSLRNNGLDSVYTKDIDLGHYNVTLNPADKGKFRTPNLRNIALRTHFMHDGRFTTLEEVIEFYNTGVSKGPTVDALMKKSNRQDLVGLGLNDLQKQQLVAFLKTFTDSTMINNPLFQAP